MKSVEKWLNLTATQYEAETKAELARLLTVSRSSISQQQHGIYAICTKTAVKIAELLGVFPMLVIASTEYAQAKSEKDKDFWKAIYAKWEELEKRCPNQPECEKTKELRKKCYTPPTDWKKP